VAAQGFRGFPPEAIAFFAGLEADNSKAYWTANLATYQTAVRGPMEALIATVDDEFKPLRIFRPNRDVRFSKDKSPYKTSISAVGERAGGAAYYVALSSEGLFVGSGYWHLGSDQLARYRDAVDDEGTGTELGAIVKGLPRGYDVHGDDLKTAPRGFARDHPRIDLLRKRRLSVGRSWAPASWLHTAKARDRVEEAWRVAGPLDDWLDANVGPSEMPPEDDRSIW
jgi:uncharacterized protein (TIGR02453 family)